MSNIKILKQSMDELLKINQYMIKNKQEDAELNRILNYWYFLEEKEAVIQETLEVILYSKYYWCSRYKDRYTKLYGTDEGLEQQQYKIMEELEQRLNNDIDWDFLTILEKCDT